MKQGHPGLATAVLLVMGCLAACGDTVTPEPVDVTYEVGLVGFPARLDSLRVQLRIPGMSAALVHDGEVIWARGFGLANVETHLPATSATPFHLASLTKPFAATVVMQLVEAGSVDLDAPVERLRRRSARPGRHPGSPPPDPHVGGHPGSAYHYSGNRFAYLDRSSNPRPGGRSPSCWWSGSSSLSAFVTPRPTPAGRSVPLTGLDRNRFMEEMAAGYELRGSEVLPLGTRTTSGSPPASSPRRRTWLRSPSPSMRAASSIPRHGRRSSPQPPPTAARPFPMVSAGSSSPIRG